jgi:hypothetical protein
MASQNEWQAVAEQLGTVISNILDEFEEMCRGSDHEEEALAALAALNELRAEA